MPPRGAWFSAAVLGLECRLAGPLVLEIVGAGGSDLTHPAVVGTEIVQTVPG